MQHVLPVVVAVWFKREKRVARFGVDVGTHSTVPHLRAVPLLLIGPMLTLWVPGYQFELLQAYGAPSSPEQLGRQVRAVLCSVSS